MCRSEKKLFSLDACHSFVILSDVEARNDEHRNNPAQDLARRLTTPLVSTSTPARGPVLVNLMPRQPIRAIETRYKGHRFRSRTEARWAVFMDCLGVEWEYEREGYELPHGKYLPDFWLPVQESFFEVKGEGITDRESRLAWDLCEASQRDVFVVCGPPNASRHPQADAFISVVLDDSEGQPTTVLSGGYRWATCVYCGFVMIVRDEVSWPRFWWDRGSLERRCCFDCGKWSFDSVRIYDAYRAASSSRFEFGESGLTAKH